MKLSPEKQRSIQCQFDCFCKKILRNEKIDFERQKCQYSNNLCIDSLTNADLAKLMIRDEYLIEYDTFNVLGLHITIKNEVLAKALNRISAERRSIILLSYYNDMTDCEIGKLLGIKKGKVQYQRTTALKIIKRMSEMQDNEKAKK